MPGQVDESVADRAEDLGLDRLPERRAPRRRPGRDVRTDVLEVHVAEAVGVLPDVAAGSIRASAKWPRVEAEVEVGVGDQSLDLVLELDVAAAVRMDDRVQTVTAGDDGDLPRLVEHRRPPIVGRAAARPRVAPRVRTTDVVGPVDDRRGSRHRPRRSPGTPVRRRSSPGFSSVGSCRSSKTNEPTAVRFAARQHGPQRGRVLGQVADGAELHARRCRTLRCRRAPGPTAGCQGVGEVDAPCDGAGGELDGQRVGGVVVHGQ